MTEPTITRRRERSLVFGSSPEPMPHAIIDWNDEKKSSTSIWAVSDEELERLISETIKIGACT